MRGLAALCAAAACDVTVDRSSPANTFDGIGGLSGGGATTRLLPDYKEPQRSQILDYLFKPNFGASLHTLKVEIGGDSQSTDGTESSHMHSPDSVDLHTGYEWWLMKEAKQRNPDIKLYGLAWAFPGWVGKGSGSPFKYPNLTAQYLVEWVSGAKKEYGLDIDYLGIWNERSSDSTFVQVLRSALNKAGISGTKIVVKDGGSDICDDLAKDKAYADAVDIIGLHYPNDFQDYSVCHSLGKPIWASEESSSYDDLNGAACWARVMNSHWVINQMTSSIMWNLVGSYYHGTNWYASSMLTAVEPWSGHYEVNPVIWATAHITQFTQIGWKYLANGTGSGELDQGGYYATWVDPATKNFTMNIVKISRDHAQCTRPGLPGFDTKAENVTFNLAANMGDVDTLQVWYSNFEVFDTEAPMFQHSTIKVTNRQFTLDVEVGAFYTVTTVTTGSKGSAGTIPTSSPAFPTPYADDFQGTDESQSPARLTDQIGAFEVHQQADGQRSLQQMVPSLPIGWSDPGSNGPMTLIGMREFQDLEVNISFKLPKPTPPSVMTLAATDKCDNTSFPVDLTDKQCMGLQQAGSASSPEECLAACCQEAACSVWQWQLSSKSCWIGFVKSLDCPTQAAGTYLSGGRHTSAPGTADDAACVASRVDQMWRNGVVLCVNAEGQWNLTTGGPPLQGSSLPAPTPVLSGEAGKVGVEAWHRMSLRTDPGTGDMDVATGSLDGVVLFSNVKVRNLDTGFAAIGSNGWFAVEYRNLTIARSKAGWTPANTCPTAAAGSVLTATPCARNGLIAADQHWELQASYQLLHVPTGLCAQAASGKAVLAKCSAEDKSQLFVNDYTRIRNQVDPLSVATNNDKLVGKKDGTVGVGSILSGFDWNAWAFFPNTGQLRNQYTANTKLGYPLCLSTCAPKEDVFFA